MRAIYRGKQFYLSVLKGVLLCSCQTKMSHWDRKRLISSNLIVHTLFIIAIIYSIYRTSLCASIWRMRVAVRHWQHTVSTQSDVRDSLTVNCRFSASALRVLVVKVGANILNLQSHTAIQGGKKTSQLQTVFLDKIITLPYLTVVSCFGRDVFYFWAT